MAFITCLRRVEAASLATLLTGILVAPAHAERTSLSDLLLRIQALENQMGNLTAQPCGPGQAMTGVAPDGTPLCDRFVKPNALFSASFVQGQDSLATACPAWQDFVADAGQGGFTSLTVSGSLGSPRTCSDPVKVGEILTAMLDASTGPVVSGNSSVIACGGFNWSISNFCASTPPGPPQVELKVSPDSDPVPAACSCQTASDNVYAVRPCIGNQNWGGVGTGLCAAPSQTMDVEAQ